MPTARQRSQGKLVGFTLLEMSIVIAIIAVVIAGGAVIFAASLQKQQYDETVRKLAVIQQTLYDYRRVFHRLPCPAHVRFYQTTDQLFGIESANPGRCAGGVPAASSGPLTGTFTGDTTNTSATVADVSSIVGLAAGGYVSGVGIPAGATIKSVDSATQITLSASATATGNDVTITYNTIVGGMVPTKSLKLPDDYAFDGWGRRIFYAVDARMTGTAAFLRSDSVSDIAYDPANGIERIIVLDAADNEKTDMAAYVLVSFGPNGHGAYARTASPTRITAASTNARELENCDCNTAAASGTFDNTFAQLPYTPDPADPTAGFDDIVVYATRAQLAAADE